MTSLVKKVLWDLFLFTIDKVFKIFFDVDYQDQNDFTF